MADANGDADRLTAQIRRHVLADHPFAIATGALPSGSTYRSTKLASLLSR